MSLEKRYEALLHYMLSPMGRLDPQLVTQILVRMRGILSSERGRALVSGLDQAGNEAAILFSFDTPESVKPAHNAGDKFHYRLTLTRQGRMVNDFSFVRDF